MVDWVLWIDESGDFDKSHQFVGVGGLLVRRDVASFASEAVYQALRGAVPHIPWPLHATLVQRPCMHAFWPALYAERLQRTPDELTSRCLEEMARLEPEAFEQVLEALRSGGKIPFGPTEKAPAQRGTSDLDRAINEGPEWMKRELNDRVRQVRSQICGAVQTAAERAQADSVWAVLAGEADNGDAAEGAPLQDRFLYLLSCAVERAATHLLSLGGQHTLRVLAAERYVHSGNAEPPPAPLKQQDVWYAVQHATDPGRGCVQAGPENQVVVRAGKVRAIEDAPAAHVLADWLVSAARRHGRRRSSLPTLLQRMETDVVLPTAHQGLPTIASSGRPWSYLRELKRGRPADAGLLGAADDRPWAREQASRWCAVLPLQDQG